ncbi:MAG: hypothetical protein WC926_00980 [Candidatus Paceibacterota bacterium]
MAIGLEEKKSSLRTILIVLLVVSCLGALAFFAIQSDIFKGKTEQSAAVELESQEIKVDFDFLRSGVIEKLVKIETPNTVVQAYGDKIGRLNPFVPYQATEAGNEEKTGKATSTQSNNSVKE